MKKQYIAAAIVAGSLGLGGLGVGVVSAATDTKPASLVDELAQEFNLKKADVQAVFDQHKTEMDANREQKFTEKLDAAVTKGTITSAQKDLIVKKVAELKASRDANRDAMKDKTQAERQAAMKADRDALQTWADANKIPMDLLMGGMGGPGGGHMRGGDGAGEPPAQS